MISLGDHRNELLTPFSIPFYLIQDQQSEQLDRRQFHLQYERGVAERNAVLY
jgi:hypothetical protein